MITTDPNRWYNRHEKAVISMASYKKIQANVDSNLALQAEDIFKDIGLNTTTAINVFLKKVVATGGIPFELKKRQNKKQQEIWYKPFQNYLIKRLNQRKISRIG